MDSYLKLAKIKGLILYEAFAIREKDGRFRWWSSLEYFRCSLAKPPYWKFSYSVAQKLCMFSGIWIACNVWVTVRSGASLRLSFYLRDYTNLVRHSGLLSYTRCNVYGFFQSWMKYYTIDRKNIISRWLWFSITILPNLSSIQTHTWS